MRTKYLVKRHAVVQPEDETYRLIPLTHGLVTTVSAHRFESLSQFNWSAFYSKAGRCFYAVRRSTEAGRPMIYMHREIAGNPPHHTDHRNGNTLDNRDENLRPSTSSQNGANRGKQRTNTSGFKGVAKNGKSGWMGKINCMRKQIYLGTFQTREAAARAYDAKAIELFGEFAKTNFPRSSYPDIAVTPPHAEGSSLA